MIFLFKSKQPVLVLINLLMVMINKTKQNIKNSKSKIGDLENRIPVKNKKLEESCVIEIEMNSLNKLSKSKSSINYDTVMNSTHKSNANDSTGKLLHCNCKVGCKNNRCPCKQKDKLCNISCHNGSICLNLNKD